MGNTQARNQKNTKADSNSKQPVSKQSQPKAPIQGEKLPKQKKSESKTKQKKRRKIRKEDIQLQPIKDENEIKGSLLTEDTNQSKRENKTNAERVLEEPKVTQNGGIKKERMVGDQEDVPKRQKPKKRLSHRKQKQQIEKEKKMQRVTKEQLRSLASSLKRTSWYLGRRLGMDNTQAKKYELGYATEEERKYQMLLWWRRVRGWKATVQQLVILLELGQYSDGEYISILTSANGDVTIYDKAPELLTTETDGVNNKRELYHYDPKQTRSFGNMAYDSTVDAQAYEKQHKERNSEKKAEKRREDKKDESKKDNSQKQRTKHRSSEQHYNTLPPWFKRPDENLEKDRRSRPKDSKRTRTRNGTKERTIRTKSKESLDRQTPDSQRSKDVVYAEISKSQETLEDSHKSPQDGDQSNTSHTDDSGIVTSPPTSPREVEEQKLTVQVQDDQNQPTTSADYSTIVREPTRGSKTLIVRRCSDSVVKLRYGEEKDKKKVKIAKEPPIEEHKAGEEEEIPVISNHDNYESANQNREGAEDSNDVTRTNTISDDIIHDVTGSIDDITDDDITNSNANLSKIGYKKDIRSMIKKYETLTKINQKKKRESMAESMARYYEWSTLPKDFTQGPTTTMYDSRTSLNSGSSYRSGKKSHRRSQYIPRYHYFTFGGKGRFPSRFKGLISGLAVFTNGEIVASDGDNKRIQIFDKRGRFVTTFDTNTELKPKGVCITPDNNIAVCCGDAVNVYDREGHIHLSFGHGVFRNNSYCVTCDANGNFYVTDIVSHTISVHDTKGKIRKRFGFEGTSMIHFNQPVSLAINSENRLYITDSQNHCIKVYTLSGRPLFRIGAKGSADGLFWNPLGICIDDSDQLYVADCGNNRISQFTSDGNFVQHLLTEADGIWMPSLVQVNKKGQLIICEWERQLIKVFTIETAV